MGINANPNCADEAVLRQASNGDYHGFPQSVDAFSENGTVIQIVGGDNIVRHKLYIPGSYKGKDGNFEYIRNRFIVKHQDVENAGF